MTFLNTKNVTRGHRTLVLFIAIHQTKKMFMNKVKTVIQICKSRMSPVTLESRSRLLMNDYLPYLANVYQA